MTAPSPAGLSPLLDQLDEAREKATPGPWEHNPINGVHTPVGSCVATTHRHNDDERRADAALIVAEHNAVPLLVAAIRAVAELADEWYREGSAPVQAMTLRRAITAALTPGADTAGATA